jgi:hypothetical protein
MTGADERLMRLLMERDAPVQDDAFVVSVMSRAEPRLAAAPGLPAFLRPLAAIAPLLALAVIAPFLVEGLRVILAESDGEVVTVSVALALGGWFLLGAFRRTFGPVRAT